MDFEFLVLFLNEVDKVDAKLHLLLSKSILKKLLSNDDRPVAEDADHQCSGFLEERCIRQVLRVRVDPFFVEELGDTGRGSKHGVVDNF